ncbi:MAG: hypothetical protein KatS3mg084_0372 [Candidatus Dojkabacteria bacterium]|nr:MAG: hypothetical protein KatS3mg084_0372 [Candidatus Dojkabacteria bacterium]
MFQWSLDSGLIYLILNLGIFYFIQTNARQNRKNKKEF